MTSYNLTPLDDARTTDGSSAVVLIIIFSFLIFLQNYDEIPPVTLAVMVGHILIHNTYWLFGVRLADICMDTLQVWNREQWYRVMLAPLYHANDYHIGFCLSSFYVKGSMLEEYFGSYVFFLLIILTALLVNLTTIPVSFMLEYYLQDPSHISRCTIGFSGAIMALKVITTVLFHKGALIGWFEFPILCMLLPKLTIVGNLSGIVVGIFMAGWLWRVSNYRRTGRLVRPESQHDDPSMEGLTDPLETLHGWVQGFANEVNAMMARILTERPSSLEAEPAYAEPAPPELDTYMRDEREDDRPVTYTREEREDDRPLRSRPSPPRHDDRRECTSQTAWERRDHDRPPCRRHSPPYRQEHRRDGTCQGCKRHEMPREADYWNR